MFDSINVEILLKFHLVIKMAELKFSLDTFRQHDSPNLLINILDYAYHVKEKGCNVCQTYQGWCMIAAREKWSDQLIDFDFVIDNLQKQNRNWVNFDQFSTAARNQIYMYLLKEKTLV